MVCLFTRFRVLWICAFVVLLFRFCLWIHGFGLRQGGLKGAVKSTEWRISQCEWIKRCVLCDG